MTALAAGHIRVKATLAGRAVVRAAVACDRPHLAAALARLAPADIPAAAGRLYAVCATSQSLAARAALAAAGAAVAPIEPARAQTLLAAERLVEHLRATAIGLGDAAPPTAAEAAALRAVLAAGAAVIAGAPPDSGRIAGALDELGLGSGAPAADRWAGRVLAALAPLDFVAAPLDRLAPDDDDAVVAALERGGAAFAARPHLPGRRPETGPLARNAAAGRGGGSRLAARFAEIAGAARLLSVPAEAAEPWLRAGALAPGLGFAAVESPRGRLHHLVALSGESVVRYLILAPTEWNFAPDGPFAAALRALRLPPDAPAARTIERLAALHDPCVGCDIAVDHAVADDALHEAAAHA